MVGQNKLEVTEVTTHAIVFDEQRQQILLIKWITPLGHKEWGFPGGHIKLGEKIQDAVKREVKEETGYDIEIDQLLGVYDNIDTDIPLLVPHVIIIVYLAQVKAGILTVPEDEDIITVKWASLTQTNYLNLSPYARKCLNDALALLTKKEEATQSQLEESVKRDSKFIDGGSNVVDIVGFYIRETHDGNWLLF
jgi:ADP-ribose pyrophosphatase YjhB (NUDIX family)